MDDLEKRRRARAAAGYSLLSQAKLVEQTGIKYDRLRSFLGPKGRNAPTLDELVLLVAAAGLPESFARDGQPEPTQDVAHDINDLRASVVSLTAQLARQERAIRALRETGRRTAHPEESDR